MRLRPAALLTTLMLGLALPLTLLPAPAQSATPVPLPGSVTWGGCSDPELDALALQCATLEVPLDHADPTGPTIRLALTRRVHTSSAAAYRGVMLTNPGGPGGSGLTLPTLSDAVPGGVGARYDWIGFDPRGVGRSSPSLHCSRSYFGPDRPRYRPDRPAIPRYWLTKNRAYAAACAHTAAQRALLPHLRTLDTVADMESIRVALGAQRLSYYGFSYGTYLGQVYATRYPTRVDRFVLDGVVDPARVWYAANLDQDRAFDTNLDVFWRYLARHPGAFHLGRRWKEVRRGYYRTARRLDRHAAVGGRLGPSELADVMLGAGYYVYDWVALGEDYARLVRTGRGAAIYRRYVEADQGDDNGFAVYNAVQCSDVAWPGRTRTLADARTVARRAPFLTWGNTWFNAPCLTWPVPGGSRPTVQASPLTPRLLLVSETRDAATPYSGALAVRARFPSASLVAGLGGTTHASSLSGVACVDRTVAAYLASGSVPARLSGTRADRTCPRLAPPQPSGSDGRVGRAAPTGMSPVVRAALEAAQRSGG